MGVGGLDFGSRDGGSGGVSDGTEDLAVEGVGLGEGGGGEKDQGEGDAETASSKESTVSPKRRRPKPEATDPIAVSLRSST